MISRKTPSYSKLLIKVADAMDDYDCQHEHADWNEMSSVAIDAVAEWFDEVLEVMGIMPSAIPSLLHWQAHSHEYAFSGDNEMDDETFGIPGEDQSSDGSLGAQASKSTHA